MALNILWSPRALENFHSVIVYLEKNWGDAVTRDFVARTEKILNQIVENPQMFRQVSSSNSTREALITKHNLLLYRIQKNAVTLLAVFDTRQHPRKKKIT